MAVLAVTSQADWYLTRSTGAVALVLLTAIVLLGILGPMRLSGTERWPRFTVATLHRDLSLLALAVLTVHIVTAALDSYAPIGWLDALVPLHSAYRPVWVGLGATALDLLLALVLTSLVRRRLGYDRWHGIHWLAYACWPIALLHGLGTGSDARQGWMQWLTAACLLATAGAVAARLTRARQARPWIRVGSTSALLAVPTGIVGFAFLGPFQSGWAATAGTPAALLRSHAARPRQPTELRRFADRLGGRIRRSPAPGGALIDLSLVLRGAEPGTLRIRLAGRPLASGGITLVGSQVDLSSPGLGGVYAGTITHLAGSRFSATVRQAGGAGWTVRAALSISPVTARVAGRITGAALR